MTVRRLMPGISAMVDPISTRAPDKVILAQWRRLRSGRLRAEAFLLTRALMSQLDRPLQGFEVTPVGIGRPEPAGPVGEARAPHPDGLWTPADPEPRGPVARQRS